MVLYTKPNAEPPIFRAGTGKHGRLHAPVFKAMYQQDCVHWLWMDRIPRGRVTLIEGPGGAGKSFVALDLAARVSVGAPWPEGPGSGEEPGDSLLLCRQDTSQDLLARRLHLAGANPERLFRLNQFLTVDREEKHKHFRPTSFPFDLPAIEHFLDTHKAVRLVVIDPLSDCCAGRHDLRETVLRLNEIAAGRNICVIATLRADCRFDGQGRLQVRSRWPTDAARCTWCVVADPHDPARRLFVPTRMNFCVEPCGLAFHIENGQVVWEPAATFDASDPVQELSGSALWLSQLLAEGDLPATDVFRQGNQYGYSPRMLRNAGRKLNIQRKRIGFGRRGHWDWSIARNGHASNGEAPAQDPSGPASAPNGDAAHGLDLNGARNGVTNGAIASSMKKTRKNGRSQVVTNGASNVTNGTGEPSSMEPHGHQ
jgi:hypothetical protein